MAFPNDTARYDSIEIDGVLTNALPVGAIVFDTATGLFQRSTDAAVATFQAVGSSVVSRSLADSTTLTALAAPTEFDVRSVLPANTLIAGSILKVKAVVRSIAVNGADTLQYTLRIGGAAMVASTALNVGANNRVELEGSLLLRAAPGAAVEGSGYFSSSDLSVGAATNGPAAGAVLTYATNAAIIIDVLATFSSANAGNQGTLESLTVELA